MSVLGDLGTAIKNKLALKANIASPTFTGVVTAPTFSGSLSGNATTAGGLAVATGTNNVANQIVRTDGNGYIQCGYIQSSGGNEHNNASPSYVWGTNGSDNYMRTYNTSYLSVNYANTSGSCSGNAATATTAANADMLDGLHAYSFLREDGWDSSPGKDANTQENMKVDFTYANNAPYVGPLVNLGVSDYLMQFNGTYNTTSPGLAFRTKNGDNGTWNRWRDVAFTDSNITGNAATATTASSANQLNGRNFYWSGQGGQPSWLWGGNDGTNMYVYNPSNFSVNYATSATYAATAAVGTNDTQIATTAFVANAVTSSVPVSTIIAIANGVVPTGFLECNGALLSRAVYAKLFAVIGTTYGVGDGSTTFAIPDLRGEFIRGFDNGRGIDSGRTLGTQQGYDWKGFYMMNTGQNTYNYNHNEVYHGKSTTGYNGNTFVGGWSAPAAALGTKWDTSEIRPRNVAMMYCIKY